jgi:AAA15 family ATPase/GTPase
LLETNRELSVPDTLKKEEILGTPEVSQAIVLKKIQGIRNVNALPDNSELSFAHKGLTVIYGENGAGKSGWPDPLKLYHCGLKSIR